MHRVVHFELSGENPEKIAKFYKDAFGWQVTKWDGPAEYWLVSTGPEGEPGINGGILKCKDGTSRTVNTISVASVDEAVKKVEALGGKVAMEKMTIPGVGYQAYCLDPEGLLFGVHQFDKSAK
jgi:predicted enzyme related to lactoylglutathione lyase